MKKISIFFAALTINNYVNAQIALSTIKGSIGGFGTDQNRISVKILLNGIGYSDSIIVRADARSFVFSNVPYGVYDLTVISDRSRTGLMNLIVEDILVGRDTIFMDSIFLVQSKSCGDGVNDQFWTFDLVEKTSKDYYPIGEWWREGPNYIETKYFTKHKKELFTYKKNGLWKYYYKSGSLSSFALYDMGRLNAIVEFYENGNIKSKGSYKYCKSGEWLYLDSNGEILFRIEFIDISERNPLVKLKYEYLKGYARNYKLIDG